MLKTRWNLCLSEMYCNVDTSPHKLLVIPDQERLEQQNLSVLNLTRLHFNIYEFIFYLSDKGCVNISKVS